MSLQVQGDMRIRSCKRWACRLQDCLQENGIRRCIRLRIRLIHQLIVNVEWQESQCEQVLKMLRQCCEQQSIYFANANEESWTLGQQRALKQNRIVCSGIPSPRPQT